MAGIALTINSYTTSSISFTAVVDSEPNLWQYSLDGGKNYYPFSTSSSQTAVYTISGLQAKSYSLKISARVRSAIGTLVYVYSDAKTVDLSLPVVSVSASDITNASFLLSMYSSVECNLWQYSLNGGTSWTTISTENGNSATATVDSLAPSTTYNVKVRARRASLEVYGTADIVVKTAGGASLTEVQRLQVDEASPVLAYTMNVIDATHTYTLEIKDGGQTVLSTAVSASPVGLQSKTVSLTSTQRNTILSHMSSAKEIYATLVLKTYNGSTMVGEESVRSFIIYTTSALSAPTFTGFTLSDVNPQTMAMVSGNNFVRGKSSVVANCTPATAKNGATISKYKVSVGTLVVESSTASVSIGAINDANATMVSVEVEDSRGYTARLTQQIAIIPYVPVSVNSWNIKRLNDAESALSIDFSGTYSPVVVGGTAKNSIQSMLYRYKKVTETTWGDWLPLISYDASGGSFSFSDHNFGIFSVDDSYDFQVRVQDNLSSTDLAVRIANGVPLMSFRKGEVNVNGLLKMNALPIVGYRGVYSGNLDDLKTSGFYSSPTGGLIVVIGDGDAAIQFQVYDDVQVRTYYFAWNPWKTL